MKAKTIQDLQRALAVSEQFNQTVIDLQIDRALLRELLSEAMIHQGGRNLAASTQRSKGLFELIDVPPLQGYSDEENAACGPDSGPNSHAHMTLSQLIAKGAAK